MKSTDKNRLTQSSESFFKTLRTWHIALVVGVVLFLSISTYPVESGGFGEDEDLNNALLYIAPLMAMAGIFASRFMFNKRRESLQTATTLQEKTEGYQAAVIVRWALIEGPTFFSVIAFMLTSNYVFGEIAFLMLVYLFLQRPNLESALEDLNLNHADFDKVRNPESIIFDSSKNKHETE
ncbi:MAG: hypothetical protein ACI9UJ_000836 [bacterium]|jgi:hypothetical protein